MMGAPVMAIFEATAGMGRGFNIRSDFQAGDLVGLTSTTNIMPFYFAGTQQNRRPEVFIYEFLGSGFSLGGNGRLASGTVEIIGVSRDVNTLFWGLVELSVSVQQLYAWADARDTSAMLGTLFNGADQVFGSTLGDTLAGFAGNDVIRGDAGNDQLFGDGGNDSLFGGTGNDVILGGHGNDFIAPERGLNSVNGDAGVDTLQIDAMRRNTTVSIFTDGRTMDGNESIPSVRGNANAFEQNVNFGGMEIITFRDGRLVFASNDPAMQVARMYQTATGSAPDTYGLNWWIDHISAGVSLRSMASSFTSGEFTAKFGALNNAQFVSQLYQNSAGRAPTSGELSFWNGQLGVGMTRGDVMLAFSEYVETKDRVSTIYSNGLWDQDGMTASIARLYQATLDRRPDSNGLGNWRAEMAAGKSLLDIVPGFLNSREFTSIYGTTTNTQFVTLLYNNVLDRAPDTAGLNDWVGQLNSGALSRAQVVLGFSESLEFRLGTMSWIEGGVVFA